MNKDCPLKFLQCGGHCKYFRQFKTSKGVQLEACMFNPCYQFPQPEGKGPEECYEGTNMAKDCVRLLKGQHWDECPYGGKRSSRRRNWGMWEVDK